MATKEQLLAQKKALEAKIAKGKKIDITTTTASERLKYMKSVDTYRKQLAEVNKQLAGQPKTPPKSTTPYVPSKSGVASNVPVSVATDPNLMQEIAVAGGIDLSKTGTFQVGGVGNTSLVWLGDKGSTGKLEFDPITNKPKGAVISDLKYAPTYSATWWTDAALQKKIIGAYASKGVTLTLQDGYQVWNSVVNLAAQVYNGGKGAKMTPFDLLNDTLKGVKSQGPAARQTSVDKVVHQYSDAEVSSLINQYASQYVNRSAKAEEISKLLPELKKKLQAPSVDKSVPIGKNDTTRYSNPAFSDADVANYIKNFYTGTVDYLENKSQTFLDFIHRNR